MDRDKIKLDIISRRYKGTPGIVEGMKLKFMDYFFYSIVGSERIDVNSIGGCMQECGSGKWKNKCCAAINMYHSNSRTKAF